jgi:hypothetical protein
LARVPNLTLVYQDAYFDQLNDRYKGKRDQFQQLAKVGHGQADSDRDRHGAQTRFRRPRRRN